MQSALADHAEREEASEFYKWALQFAPADSDAHFGMGLAQLKLGSLSNAASALHASLQLSPGKAERSRVKKIELEKWTHTLIIVCEVWPAKSLI